LPRVQRVINRTQEIKQEINDARKNIILRKDQEIKTINDKFTHLHESIEKRKQEFESIVNGCVSHEEERINNELSRIDNHINSANTYISQLQTILTSFDPITEAKSKLINYQETVYQIKEKANEFES